MNTIEIVIKGIDEFSGVFSGLGGALEGVGKIAGGALTIGLGAAAAGLAALGVGAGIALNEAMSAEMAIARLEAVIKSTGGVAGVSSEAAQALAMQLRDLAGGSDDAVIAVESILLRFTEIGSDVFPQATETTLNMAAALGVDANEAAQMLGRSLSDVEGGSLSLLQRSRLLSSATIDQATAMAKAGDAAGAQKLILDALATATGGAAAAAAGTFSGQLEIMKGHMLEVAEGIGAKLLPLLKDGLAWIMPIVETAAKQISASFVVLLPHVEELARSAGVLFTQLLGVFGIDVSKFDLQTVILQATGAISDIIKELQKFVDAVSANLPGIVAFFQPVTDAVNFLVTAFVTGIPIIVEFVKEKFTALVTFFQPLIDAILTVWNSFVTGVPSVQTIVGGFVSWMGEQWTELVTMFQPLIDAVTLLLQTFMDSLPQMSQVVSTMKDSVVSIFNSLWPEISSNLTSALAIIIDLVTTGVNTVTAIWQQHGAQIQAVVEILWNAVVLTVGGAIALISGVIESGLLLVQGIVNAVSLAIKGDWQGAWNAIMMAVSLAVLNIMTSVNSIFESIASKMGTSMDDIRKTWQADWDLLKTILVQAMTNARNAVAGKIDEVATVIHVGIKDAIQAVEDTFDSWVQLGQDIVANIALGISMMVAGLIADVVKMVTDALAAAGAALGLGVPGSTGGVGGTAPVVGGGVVGAPVPGAATTGGGNVFNFYPANDLDIELVARRVMQVVAAG